MMPKIDGWEVCRTIRESSNVPVIMLTARSQEFDELTGFESGADDYVIKPCSPSVLMKRVAAMLRRDNAKTMKTKFTIGELTLDSEAHVPIRYSVFFAPCVSRLRLNVLFAASPRSIIIS